MACLASALTNNPLLYGTGSITNAITNQWYIPTGNATTINIPYIDPYLYAWQSIQYATVITFPSWPVETDERRIAREVREAEDTKVRVAASNRAEELLLKLLSEEQRETWKNEKRFDVVVAGKLYRLRDRSRAQLIENGKAIIEFCIHPGFEHGLPAPDVVLAQKLLLETNESEFLRIANHTKVA